MFGIAADRVQDREKAGESRGRLLRWNQVDAVLLPPGRIGERFFHQQAGFALPLGQVIARFMIGMQLVGQYGPCQGRRFGPQMIRNDHG